MKLREKHWHQLKQLSRYQDLVKQFSRGKDSLNAIELDLSPQKPYITKTIEVAKIKDIPFILPKVDDDDDEFQMLQAVGIDVAVNQRVEYAQAQGHVIELDDDSDDGMEDVIPTLILTQPIRELRNRSILLK